MLHVTPRDIDLTRRRCKLSDETDGMHVFQRYSKDACDLENKLHFAVDTCGYCVPWNIPMMSLLIPDNVYTRFCDAFEHRCMSDAIANLDTPYNKVSKMLVGQNHIQILDQSDQVDHIFDWDLGQESLAQSNP